MWRNADNPPKSVKSMCEHFFLHYGAGSRIFAPITNCKLWNRFCWIVIALGIAGWIVGLWLLRSYSE